MKMITINSFRALKSNRSLIYSLAVRDFITRYKGTLLGITWSLVHPLVLLGLYSMIFTLIFKPRWHTYGDTPQTMVMFSGIVLFLFISQVISQSASVLRRNPSFIKKVQFPVVILPVVSVLSAGIQTLISLALLLILCMFINGAVTWSWVWLPVILLPLVFVALGMAWILSTLGLFVKDISEIAGLMGTLLLFTSGAILPINLISTQYLSILNFNPLTIIIESFRGAVFNGNAPDLVTLSWYYLSSLIFMCLAMMLFTRSRRLFADVI